MLLGLMFFVEIMLLLVALVGFAIIIHELASSFLDTKHTINDRYWEEPKNDKEESDRDFK